MTYPNEQLPAGRPLRRAPAYDAMTADGAHWGVSWGLEVPLYFAPEGFVETPTQKRSNAHRHRRRRMPGDARRASACSIPPPSPATRSRGRARGNGSTSCWPASCRRRGRAKLAPMLSRSGRLHGRSHRVQLGRRQLVAHGLLLSAPMAYALVREPAARQRRGRCGTSPMPSAASACRARDPGISWRG